MGTAPTTTPPHQGAQSHSITRESLIALAREPKPWKALALFATIHAQIASDIELRFHGIACLAKLGLRELAEAESATLPPALHTVPQFQSLNQALKQLPHCEIGHRPGQSESSGLHALARHVALLVQRSAITPDFAGSLRAIAEAHGLRWFAALDGNVVCWQSASGQSATGAGWPESILPRLGPLLDEIGRAPQTIRGMNESPETCPAPLLIDGLGSPWLLMQAHHDFPKTSLGYRRPLLVIQDDALTLAAGLGMTDLAPVLSDDRVHCFLGPDAAARLTTFLAQRHDRQLPMRAIGKFLPGSFVRTVVEQAAAEQSAACVQLRAKVEANYAARDRAFWNARFAEAVAGQRRLKVLIPTCRYSTFIQHSSADIADGLREIGHEARVLIEPDDQSILSANAYWQAFAEFEPDLVILINYPRCERRNIAPKNVPWVTWLQDAMPHLFTQESAAGQTDLDFAVGYLFGEMFDHAQGWPRQRAMHAPVLANPKKFFVEGARPDPRLVCDVAFVSHHHETPQQMHARLVRSMGGAGFAPLAEALRVGVEQIVAQANTLEVRAALRAMIGEVAPAHLRKISAQQQDELLHAYCSPMAGQIFRHQALEWAAEICNRRGWTLHLYGKGWEQHPTLGRWARGVLAHGAELRQAYAAARLHLHLDVNTLTHQRIVEGALSGGLLAARFVADALKPLHNLAEIATALEPVDVPPSHALPHGAWKIAQYAALREHEELRKSLGLHPMYPSGVWPRTLMRVTRREQEDLATWPGMNPAWLWGGLQEQFFTSPAGLEALIERAITDEAWRGARAQAMRERCLAQMTYGTTCGRMLRMLALDPDA
jgi:hypothetical protein